MNFVFVLLAFLGYLLHSKVFVLLHNRIQFHPDIVSRRFVAFIILNSTLRVLVYVYALYTTYDSYLNEHAHMHFESIRYEDNPGITSSPNWIKLMSNKNCNQIVASRATCTHACYHYILPNELHKSTFWKFNLE